MHGVQKLVLPAIAVIALVLIAWFGLGPVPAAVFLVAFGGGLVFYIATTWRTEIDVSKVIIPYLLAIVLFMVHTFEEYVMNFETVTSRMAGREISEQQMLFIIAWMAPILWVSGAILLLKRTAFGNYFLCAFFITLTIAELSHFVFPFVVDGTFHYEAGMYTALLPLIPAAFGLYIMLREVRAARAVRAWSMNRRNLLIGAGAASAIGLGCAAASFAGMGSSDAYTQAMMQLRALPGEGANALDLVRVAALAANGHNTQPWRFSLAANEIRIEPDFARRTPIVDPDDHHLYVSLGCAALAGKLPAFANLDRFQQTMFARPGILPAVVEEMKQRAAG